MNTKLSADMVACLATLANTLERVLVRGPVRAEMTAQHPDIVEARRLVALACEQHERSKVALRRIEDHYGDAQWVVVGRPEFRVVRRKWELPIVYSSYTLTRDGKELDSDLPTLADVRDCVIDFLTPETANA